MSSVDKTFVQVGTAERLARRSARPGGVELFAIEPDQVQIVWPEGTMSPVRAQLGGRSFELDQACIASGAGMATIDGLRPETSYELVFSCSTADGPRRLTRRFTTPAAPLGEELFRFATISDLHLGRGTKKFKGPLAHVGRGSGDTGVEDFSDPTAEVQLQVSRSAISEAISWGAGHLILKGDVCDQGYDWIWDQVADLLRDVPVPISIIPGNHDTGGLRRVEPEFAAKERGLHVTRSTEVFNVPGLSLILTDSTVPGTSWGSLQESAEEVADLAAESRRSGRGVAVMSHHHAQRFAIPLFWPHGIPGPDAKRFATELAKAAPDALVTSGHTHRCRTRSVAGVTWGEVASACQFPAVWAGYVVHEGGLRQTVHRVAEPASLELVEAGRSLLNGVWALWSVGTLRDRCFSIAWSH